MAWHVKPIMAMSAHHLSLSLVRLLLVWLYLLDAESVITSLLEEKKEHSNLKISYFGLSALPGHLKNGFLHSACAMPAYTAPEILPDIQSSYYTSCTLAISHLTIPTLQWCSRRFTRAIISSWSGFRSLWLASALYQHSIGPLLFTNNLNPSSFPVFPRK